MNKQQGETVFLNALLFGCLGLLVFLLQTIQVFGERISYAALTLLLMFYLWLEVERFRQNVPQRWLLNPTVFCAFIFFFMGYGLSNMLFFLPPETIEFLGLVPEVSPAMVTHQYLILIGALAMLLGYWSSFADALTRANIVARFQEKLLPRSDELPGLAIPLLITISFGARLYAMREGLYGYGGDFSAERLAVTSAYSQYISMASGLGKLALILAGLQYFSSEKSQRDEYWFWLALVIEVLFGFLSGMKSAVGMPLVIAGVCFYLRTGKIPKNWILLTFAAILVAYAVIEPFRAERSERGGPLTSVSQIADVLGTVVSDGNSSSESLSIGETILSIVARNNLSYIGSFGIEYADTYEKLPEGSPAFLEDIFLAPLHALIPRFLWDSKPLSNLGLWYNQVVMGLSHFSSTAMGPFAYLYFAGGFVAVPIAFFLIGVVQRMMFLLLSPWNRNAGAVVFLFMLPTITNIDSAVNSILIIFFRDFPIVLILVHLIFLRNPKGSITRGSIT